MSVLLANADVFIDGKLQKKNIVIEDSKVKEITNNEVTVDRHIDLAGKIILPGIIDPHVHFREPGLEYKEDFFTGSCAAAAGGVATILDMPNTQPATTTLELLNQKRELAKKAIVNYGFHFAAARDNLEEIRKTKGVASIKVFMNVSTGNLMIEDDAVLRRIFETAKVLSVHAEAENVLKAIDMVKNTKNKLYLCHITTENELLTIKKNKNSRIYTEVTPHHLFLTSEDDKNGFFKMKPILKSKKDQDFLWKNINKIDAIGSDHAPHTIEEKQKEDFPYGVPGVETSLALMLDAVNKKRVSLGKVVEMMCHNPAKIFNLRGKGFIKEGFDADLTVVDMNFEKEVRNENLFTKCKWSPFNGKILKGWPVMTVVGGNIVFDNGKINNIKAKEVRYNV